MEVPSLSDLRSLETSDLMALRTDISDALAMIDNQLRDSEMNSPDWERSARIAQRHHQRGLGNIKNILAERSEKNKENRRSVPIGEYLTVMMDLWDSAGDFLDTVDEISELDFQLLKAQRFEDALRSLREAVTDADEFMVDSAILAGR